MKRFCQVNIEGFSRPSAKSRTKEEQGQLCRGVMLLAWSCSPTQGRYKGKETWSPSFVLLESLHRI